MSRRGEMNSCCDKKGKDGGLGVCRRKYGEAVPTGRLLEGHNGGELFNHGRMLEDVKFEGEGLSAGAEADLT